jgi:hypothetical protein
MKKLLLLLLPLSLFAKVHYAKVQPLETITLKSAVSAQVIQAKITLEGTTVKKSTIIKLDDKLDKIKITSSKKSIQLIDNMIRTNQQILSAVQESLDRQEAYYNRIEGIQSASKTQKDNAFYNYINSKTKYLSTKEKIDSLKKQRLDLKYEINRLKDNLSKKTITIKHRFLNKLLVNQGDYVNMGTPLAELKNLTSAKLVLFIELDELKDIKRKTIYIDDKKTNYKISKIWKVTDEKYISSYKTEIIIKNPKENFSKLLKVEFR